MIQLTPAEQKVANTFKQHLSFEKVAEVCGLKRTSVRMMLNQIRRKTNSKSTSELLIKLRRNYV